MLKCVILMEGHSIFYFWFNYILFILISGTLTVMLNASLSFSGKGRLLFGIMYLSTLELLFAYYI